MNLFSRHDLLTRIGRAIPTVLLFSSALFMMCSTGNKMPEGPFTADWESLSKHDVETDWFMDAKLGIYFHWGVYSVPAFGSEWYPRNMHDKGSEVYEYHVRNYGDPSEFGYHDFVPLFKAENFSADEWADLFVKAGARFAGLVAEHHDGWAMWDSELTPWNAVDKGPKRDLMGELEKAIRARGMRFATTFHHARNNLWERQNRDGQWSGHYSFVKMDFPSLLEDPENAILYGYLPREKFLELWKGKLVEVIDKYQPDLMWFDAWLDEIPDSVKTDYLAYYFNRAHEWGKEVVVTFKQDDLPQDVGVLDLEKGRMGKLTAFPWLTDDTISRGSWCYTQDLEIKPTSVVLHGLIDIVSKNGVLLLNISPKADGTIPDNQWKVLLEMGDWLKRYGEAVYETRPWIVYGEGPTKLETGRFGGVIDAAGGYTPRDIRYTQKGNAIYAILLGSPGTGKNVTLQSFAKKKLNEDLKITDVTMLECDERIRWEQGEDGLTITAPNEEIDDLAVVFKIKIQSGI